MFTDIRVYIFIALTLLLQNSYISARAPDVVEVIQDETAPLRIKRHAQMGFPMYGGQPRHTGGGEIKHHKKGTSLGAGLLGAKASVGLYVTKSKNHTYESYDSNSPSASPPQMQMVMPPPQAFYPPYPPPPPPLPPPPPPADPMFNIGTRYVRSIKDIFPDNSIRNPQKLVKIMPKVSEENNIDYKEIHAGAISNEGRIPSPTQQLQSSDDSEYKGTYISDSENTLKSLNRANRSPYFYPAEVPNRYTVNVEEDKKRRGSFNILRLLGLGAILNFFTAKNKTTLTEEYRSGNVPRYPDMTHGLYTRKRSTRLEDIPAISLDDILYIAPGNPQSPRKDEFLRKRKKYSSKKEVKSHDKSQNTNRNYDFDLNNESILPIIVLGVIPNKAVEIPAVSPNTELISENEFETVERLLPVIVNSESSNSSSSLTSNGSLSDVQELTEREGESNQTRLKRSPQFGDPHVVRTQENINSLRGTNNKWKVFGLNAKIGLNIASNKTKGSFQFDSWNPAPGVPNGAANPSPQYFGQQQYYMPGPGPYALPPAGRRRRSPSEVKTMRSGRRFIMIPPAPVLDDNTEQKSKLSDHQNGEV